MMSAFQMYRGLLERIQTEDTMNREEYVVVMTVILSIF